MSLANEPYREFDLAAIRGLARLSRYRGRRVDSLPTLARLSQIALQRCEGQA